MEELNEQKAQSETIITTIGEAYEYLRVITSNTFEIKKLEALNFARLSVGNVLMALAMGFILILIGILLTILMTLGFYNLTTSWPFALLSSIGVLFMICLCLYFLRHRLFYKIINSKIDQLANLNS